MNKQLSGDGQALALHDRVTGIGMAKIVKPDVLGQSRAPADDRPLMVDLADKGIRQARDGKDEGRDRALLAFCEQPDHGRGQQHLARPGLRGGKLKPIRQNLAPAQPEDFA